MRPPAGGIGQVAAPPRQDRIARDLFPGALDLMILRTVRQQPMHGYAIAQHIHRMSNDLLRVEEGSLYPALQRLLKAGLVKAAGAKHLSLEVSRFERMLEGITRVLAPSPS
jgi:PadR family transcriptional regulator, regulatory protein PadR